MRRDLLFATWVWTVTGVMVGLVLLTNPLKSSPQMPPIASSSKPGCMFGWTNDVNNCGILKTILHCSKMPNSGQPTSRNGQQCHLCTLGSIQIQGQQKEVKNFYDCNNDGQADCELWFAWAVPKCIIIGSTTSTTCLECELEL